MNMGHPSEVTRDVFGLRTGGDGMAWFHSEGMERFRPCVRFGKNGGTERFHFLFGWEKK